MTQTNSMLSSLSHPRYWRSWLGFGVLWLISRLPLKVQSSIGRALGRFLHKYVKRRRHIAEVNIQHCFPELSATEQSTLVKESFEQLGLSYIELGRVWWPKPSLWQGRYKINGLEHLQAAQAEGGVLLLCGHFALLDLGANILGRNTTMDGMYRANSNPVMSYLEKRGRENFFAHAIERSEIRDLIKALKQKRTVWYAPDQDFGRKNTVFAPFFGQPASTLTSPSRLSKMTGAKVLTVAFHRTQDSQYLIDISPALDNFPSGDDVADATRLNKALEDNIRKYPAQYLWVHRRFKTQEEGGDIYL
ncbi:MAG: LpxL/LpxP family Kdo(2)-lipid IV(A) lauroyl/palmitoleoyl acyltransferase [Pontibacterium sp.]